MRSRFAALPPWFARALAARRRARVSPRTQLSVPCPTASARFGSRPDVSTPLRRLTGCILLAIIAADMPAYAQDTFSVDSPDLQQNASVPPAQVYKGNGCSGANRSPELHWHNAPAGTKAYAVTIFDVDAPGPGWWHWAVTNLPVSLDHLPEDASASGFLKQTGAIEARNDYGDDGYGGPCPPPGKPHRYVVTVYALSGPDTHLAQGRPAPMFDHEIRLEALAEAKLVVTYQR
jgi:Raf kinase inhibitor-like YbhB/YbcL family protein